VVTVGSLDQPYKGIDTLLRATAEAGTRSGIGVKLTIVGEGRLRPAYESLARELGIRSAVYFAGQVPAGDAVRQHLDASDVFVLASLSEGLPRSMIEAMARGLPCLGSSVGGIPELLSPDLMFMSGDWRELARLITTLRDDPASYRSAAEQASLVAQNYSVSRLQERRVAHYVQLGELAERWSAQQQVR
jgi:glycosyltransferase involved in cell wall biosynthesis